MAVESERKKEFEDSTLVDTNILLPLLNVKIPDPYDFSTIELKMAALTCRYFLVCDITLQEIINWAKFVAKISLKPFYQEHYSWLRLYVEYFGSFENINKNIERTASEGIERLLRQKIFRVIRKAELFESANGTEDDVQKLETKISELAVGFHPDTEHNMVKHDAWLLFASNNLSLPILTMDQKIIALTTGRATSKVEIPFPFDSEAINNLELDELFDLAEPFRIIYRKAFSRIDEDISKAAHLEASIEKRNKLLAKKHELVGELSAELREAKESSEIWQSIAEPKLGETFIMTIAEALLGLFPFPIPTSPFTHFLQAIRSRRAKVSRL